jgi:pimeloyl-ACP methyl ester carboxylesterase/HEAT repeat protein
MAMALRETITVDELRIANAVREMIAVGPDGEAGLIDLLTDPVAPVRRAAGRTIGALKLTNALPHVIAALNDESPVVVLELVVAVTRFDGLWPIEALVRHLDHRDERVVETCLAGLAERDRAEIQRVIRRQLANPPVSTGPGPYLAAMGRFPDKGTLKDLYRGLKDPKVAAHALRGFAFYGPKESKGLARWMKKNSRKHPDAAVGAAVVLAKLGRAGRKALGGVLASVPLAVKRAGVDALVERDADKGAARLTDLAGHRNMELRLVALELMKDVGESDPSAHVTSNLGHKDGRVRSAIANLVAARGRNQVNERALINRYRDLARRRTAANRVERNQLITTLGKVGKEQGVSELIQAIGQDDEMETAMRALGSSGGRAVGALLFVVKTGDPVRTPLAIASLAEAGPGALEPLLKLLVHRSRDVRYTARKAVAEMGITEAVPRILELTSEPKTPGRAQLLALIGHLWCEDSLVALKEIARAHTDQEMRLAAVKVLSQRSGRRVTEVLREVARTDGSNEVRHLAVQALIWQGDAASVPTFLRMLASERDFIRETLALGLGYLALPVHVPELLERMDTPRNDIILAIRNAIRRVTYRPDLKTAAQFEDWYDDWDNREPPTPLGLQPSHLTLGDGTQMHYWIGGQGDPLLVLHDGPDLSHDYIAQSFAPLLEDYTLLFVDLPGRGKSSRPTAAAAVLGVDHDAQSVATLLVRLNLRSVNVYGHGWGAIVSARLADRHPKLVGKLVLDNAPEPTRAGWASLVSVSAERVPHPWSEDLGLFAGETGSFNPAVRDRFLSTALLTGALGRPGVLLDVAPHLKRDPALRGTIQDGMGEFDFKSSFERITQPTLMLYGTKSPMSESAIAWRDKLDKERKNVSKFVLAGTGYLPGFEYPKPWAKLIRQFLR